jgi:gluconate kinase
MKSTLNPNVLYNWKQKFIKGDKLHSQIPIKIIQKDLETKNETLERS